MTPPVPDEEMQRTLTAYFAHGGNQSRMAENLGLSRSSVQARVKRLHRDGLIRQAQETAQRNYTPDIDGSPLSIDAKPRCLFRPYTTMPRDPETVCLRTPTSSPESYFETVLTPEEAEDYALNLLIEARRAKAARSSREWLEKRQSGSEP